MPRIKSNTPSFTDFIAGFGGVIEKYMRLGAVGFRLDVVDELDDSFVEKIKSKHLCFEQRAQNPICIARIGA